MPQKQQRNKYLLDIKKIQRILPHRYPFLLVDRVLQLEKGKSIAAIKNVTCNEPFFHGHFPDVKIMPGVLIVEALAQAGGILLYHSIPDPENKFFVLSKIINASFKKPVVPGDQLQLQVKILKMKERFFHVHGKALVDGEIAAQGEVMATAVNIEEWNDIK